MATATLLDAIEIATPCPAKWDLMQGDDRVRFCGLCRKHVYDLSAMTVEEAEDLILEKERNLCIRLHRRRDGRVITSECPVGIARLQKRLKCLVGTAFGLVVLSGGIALAALQIDSRVNSKTNRTLAEQWARVREDPVSEIKQWLGINPPPALPQRAVTGGTVCMGQMQ